MKGVLARASGSSSSSKGSCSIALGALLLDREMIF